MPYRYFNEWVDVAANFLRTSNWLISSPGEAALYAALQAASNGNLLYSTLGVPLVGTTTPSDALYPLVTDIAVLNFSTTAGTAVRVTVPSPVASLFGPYGTVNASDPAAAALIAAVIGTLGDNNGNLAALFQGGSKARRTVEQVGQ